MDFWTAIATVGFPIVACVGVSVAYYKATTDFAATVGQITDTHKEEVRELVDAHKEEAKELTSSLNDLTVTLNRILEVERMEVENE